VNNLFTYGFLNMGIRKSARMTGIWSDYFLTDQPAAFPTDASVYFYYVVDDILYYGALNKPLPDAPFPYGFDVEPP